MDIDQNGLILLAIGAAWALREVLPLLLTRQKGEQHAPPGKFIDAQLYIESEKWWQAWRDDTNKRLDSHAEDLKDLAARLGRIERNNGGRDR